jgi:hypothetical protein
MLWKFEDQSEFFMRTLRPSLIYNIFFYFGPCLLILFLINKFDSIIF